MEVMADLIVTEIERPVVTIKDRKLGYKFMEEEATWMLGGRRDIFHANMAKYSDDGRTLFGAYGPRIASQFSYVVHALHKDINTRQAVLTIWIEKPPTTKDVPCTLSMQFMVRNNKLDMFVNMRSSDIWLGVPYDTFSFSCVALKILHRLNEGGYDIQPGKLYNYAASRHLYMIDFDKATAVLSGNHEEVVTFALERMKVKIKDGL
jgi:thymidylate synthase